MARPNTNNLVVNLPQFQSPVTGVGICGTSYAQTVTVRSPYQQINRYSATLRPITEGVPVDTAPLADIARAIENAQQIVDGEDRQIRVRLKLGGPPRDEGFPIAAGPRRIWSVTDAANRNAILDTIDRARFYLGWARALWDYWANEWRPTVTRAERMQGTPAGVRPPNLQMVSQQLTARWPLNVSLRDVTIQNFPTPGWFTPYGQRCFEDQGREFVTIDGVGPGQPGWRIFVACPSTEDIHQRVSDQALFRSLAEAALLWARCAQEAAAAVGIYHRNRRDAVLAPAPEGAFAPQPVAPPTIIVHPLGPLPPDLPPPPIPDPNELEGVTFPPTRTAQTARQPVPWGKVALGVAGVYAAWRLLAR